MKKYIMSLDLGTTSVRTVIFDKRANTVAFSQKEFKQIYPLAGYVEHNPLEIYSALRSSISEVLTLNNINPEDIAGIGVANQRETTVCFDRHTGIPIYNAIVWQCRRTSDYCEKLKKDASLCKYIADNTGLKIDPYFSATKIRWILENIKNAKEKAENGDLLFGTIDTYIIWKLTGGKAFVTDYTNASRTMLFNIKTLEWDEKLLKIFGIPKRMMPRAVASDEQVGYANIEGVNIPVCGIAGDQQSALFGQGCFNSGDVKCTYGTGCFLLMNTGEKIVKSEHNLLNTVAVTLKDEKPQYATEGSVFVGGAVIQWLRDELKILSSAKKSEEAAKKVEDTGGVYIVPAFAGLGAPYWNMFARGTIIGITRGTGREHIIRAALESIAFQTNDLISALESENGQKTKVLTVDGGASKNNFLMQFQADISDLTVLRRENSEATALGAAFLAGLSSGFWKDKDELSALLGRSDEFRAQITKEERKKRTGGWSKAVNAALMITEG